MTRRTRACLAILAGSLLVVAGGFGQAREAAATLGVTVSQTGCRVSPRTALAGLVRFRVVNRATQVARFSVGRRTARVRAGHRRTVTWRLTTGVLPYRCHVGSSRVGRGVLAVRPPSPPPPPPPPLPTIRVTGEPQVVFDWTTQRCDERDIPDFPARVFRDAEGRLQLVASHNEPRRMVGPSLDALTRECRPLLRSHGDPRPDAFDDQEWIAAPYTSDGRTVYALVHVEYHGDQHGSVRCPSGDPGRCWYDAMTLGVSTDGGATYTHAPPPAHVVAPPPWRYEPDQAGLGYYGGTNIVRNPSDGYFYALIGRAPRGLGHGPCVVRTPTLDDPASWRFWNGAAFEGTFADPYRTAVPDPERAVCPRVLDLLAESLSWNTHLGRWLLIGSKAFTQTDAAFVFSTSTDLVNWTPPQAFHRVELVFTYACGEPDPKAYASFIDPASPERNFDVTGRTGWLYYTQFNYRDCRMNLDRDLVRVPVTLSP